MPATEHAVARGMHRLMARRRDSAPAMSASKATAFPLRQHAIPPRLSHLRWHRGILAACLATKTSMAAIKVQVAAAVEAFAPHRGPSAGLTLVAAEGRR